MIAAAVLGLGLHFGIVVGCNAADLTTTYQAFNRGAVEGNHIVAGQPRVTLALTKASATAAVVLAAKLLDEHGHPRAARVVAFVDAGVTCAAAAHNTRVAR